MLKSQAGDTVEAPGLGGHPARFVSLGVNCLFSKNFFAALKILNVPDR